MAANLPRRVYGCHPAPFARHSGPQGQIGAFSPLLRDSVLFEFSAVISVAPAEAVGPKPQKTVPIPKVTSLFAFASKYSGKIATKVIPTLHF